MKKSVEVKDQLVMPLSYKELDQDEMSYVDGGLYISYSTMQSALFAFGKNGANVPGTISQYAAAFGGVAAVFSAHISALFSWVNSLPIIGQIIFLYVVANAVAVGSYMASAYFQKKGVDIGIGWWWFIPHVKLSIR